MLSSRGGPLVLIAVGLLLASCAKSQTDDTGPTGDCTFSIISNTISPGMATVGIVEWSTTLVDPASASIVYTLNDPPAGTLNTGGTAPVDLTKPNNRTLLLGLKPQSGYTFHIEATGTNGAFCRSESYTLPTTGVLTDAPQTKRTVMNAAAQDKGFIVSSSGETYANYAVILDADATVVWYAPGPMECSRARMDYEGVNMWMIASNEYNSTGEMRFMSMDGLTSMNNIEGLVNAHHDFTVLPGKIATMAWAAAGLDDESNLVEMNSDGSGSPTTLFEIGDNLYAAGTSPYARYHSNSIHYHASDDSFTIGDRDPNLYVKVSHAGVLQWQLGGSCSNAPAGADHCVEGTWQVNHGHHLLDDGTMLIFNNGADPPATVREFKLDTSGTTFSAAEIKDFTSGIASPVLGDVQRLPNGNTLITYSDAGAILELDPSWNPVQKILGGAWAYADWRETLYGPPSR
jgi:hypothetical protein